MRKAMNWGILINKRTVRMIQLERLLRCDVGTGKVETLAERLAIVGWVTVQLQQLLTREEVFLRSSCKPAVRWRVVKYQDGGAWGRTEERGSQQTFLLANIFF